MFIVVNITKCGVYLALSEECALGDTGVCCALKRRWRAAQAGAAVDAYMRVVHLDATNYNRDDHTLHHFQ